MEVTGFDVVVVEVILKGFCKYLSILMTTDLNLINVYFIVILKKFVY